MVSESVLSTLLTAIWRRQLMETVMVYFAKSNRCKSSERQKFLKDQNLETSMSRQGNYHNNTVAKNSFLVFKHKNIRRKIHPSGDEAE